jgi:hypothetical protein
VTRHAVPGSGIMAACGGSARFEHREFVRSGRQPAGRSDHQIGRHGPGSLATTGCTAGARRTARTSLRSCSTGAATSRERASSASSLSESHRGCLAPRFAVEVQQLRFLQPNTSVVVEGRAPPMFTPRRRESRRPGACAPLARQASVPSGPEEDRHAPVCQNPALVTCVECAGGKQDRPRANQSLLVVGQERRVFHSSPVSHGLFVRMPA